ncbi:MAG: DUF1573 domain-containing protein [Bacteroidota bacterium]
MKKILLIMFVGILSISINGQTKEEIKKDFTGPVFEFENEVIDYGDILKNSDGNRVFKFKNVGKSPLIISYIKSSCGCTVPSKPKEPIMPGETGEIKVKYATNRVGPFSKTVTINSNAFEPKKVLSIKGRVLEKEAVNNLEKKKSIVSEN